MWVPTTKVAASAVHARKGFFLSFFKKRFTLLQTSLVRREAIPPIKLYRLCDFDDLNEPNYANSGFNRFKALCSARVRFAFL